MRLTGKTFRAWTALLTLPLFLAPGYAAELPRLPVRSDSELLQLSLIAFEKGFYEHSLDYARQFTRNFPDSERKDHVLLLKALNFRKLENFEDCLETVGKLENDFPGSPHLPRAFYLEAEIRYQLKEYSRAAEIFRKALESELPAELVSPALQGLFASFSEKGDFFNAVQAWREWHGLFPGEAGSEENIDTLVDAAVKSMQNALAEEDFDPVYATWSVLESVITGEKALDRARYFVGMAHLREGRKKEAARIFRELAESENSRVLRLSSMRLADTLYREEKLDEAASFYRRAMEGEPDREIRSIALLQLGRIAARKRHTGQAESLLRQSFEEAPEDRIRTQALEERAAFMFLAGNYRRASEYYREFRELFPESGRVENAFLQESFALYNLGDYPGASSLFKAYMERYPGGKFHGKAVYGLGLSLMAAGDREKAAVLWEDFLAQVHDFEEYALMVLVLARYRLGREEPGRVVGHLEKLGDDPAQENNIRAEALLLAGIAYRITGEKEKALGRLRQGIALEPAKPVRNELIKNKGYVLLEREDYEEALEAFLAIRDSYPEKRGQVLYGIGASLEQAGRKSEAIEPYLEALVHLPEDSALVEEVENALSRIRRRP